MNDILYLLYDLVIPVKSRLCIVFIILIALSYTVTQNIYFFSGTLVKCKFMYFIWNIKQMNGFTLCIKLHCGKLGILWICNIYIYDLKHLIRLF